MPHIIEHLGRIKVVIVTKGDDAEVISCEGDSMIGQHSCKIWERRDVQDLSTKSAKKNIERLIKDYGMFTRKRKLDCKNVNSFVTYGTTEIMMTALESNIIDAAVTVSDGAGTVITNSTCPGLVQSIGGEMPGLIYTEPIIETITAIEDLGGIVLDKENARIDQVEGVERAIKEGYKKIAVSIVEPVDAERLRVIEEENDDIELILMGVHHTGRGVEKLIEHLDLMPECGKRTIPPDVEIMYRVGSEIGMCALKERGRRLLEQRADAVKKNKPN